MNPLFHLDKNGPPAIARLLNALYGDPTCAVTAASLGMSRALDGHHLLSAATAGRILVTYNAKDFVTMDDAWQRCQRAWGTTNQHAGILIIPQDWKPAEAVAEIMQWLGSRLSLPNEIYAYVLGSGWTINPRIVGGRISP